MAGIDNMDLPSEQYRQRQLLYRLLGDLPARDGRIQARLVRREERAGYLLETLVLELNGDQPVPAYFVKPRRSHGRSPCILYNHAHAGDYRRGKDELLLGRPELSAPPYAEALTAHGWAALCIDAWGFGERAGRTESELFKEMLWKGQVLWGRMVYDSLRAIDYLLGRPDVDGSRLGTLGLSMGSTMAWWLAALEPRIAVCVDICCMTDFDALIAAGGLDGHGIYYYVPALLKHFSTAGINALIAPRPHLSLAGDLDPLTPPQGLERIDRELREVYAALGASEAWQMRRYPGGHQETADMREEALAFLEKWL
ncbi:MAG TPA: acetylxylan esterase [Anaerolineales bacterium]|nr:acetylxylan esterase [Anaerolineales bacterium]